MGNLTGSSTAEIDAPIERVGGWSRTLRRRPTGRGSEIRARDRPRRRRPSGPVRV